MLQTDTDHAIAHVLFIILQSFYTIFYVLPLEVDKLVCMFFSLNEHF